MFGRWWVILIGAGLSVSPAWAQTNEGIRPAEPAREVEATRLSKVPKQTQFVKAEYPKQAEEQGIEAEVVLLLDIDAEGKVEGVGIAEPADPPNLGFDEAAIVAAQQFEFEPAELDGKPVAVQITYRYKFTLTPKAPPPASSAPSPEPSRAKDLSQPMTETPAKSPAGGVKNLGGVLRERGTRLPLPGLIVTVFRGEGPEAEGYEATSGPEGRFEFVDLPPGTWKVLIEAPGYYPFRTSEKVTEREAVEVTYYVERGTYNPFDVTITATRPEKEVSRTVITTEEIEKVPGGMGDPLTVVQNFAGVARVDNPGLLVVRGSAPEDTRIFVDGTIVPLIYHFGGLRSVVPAGMLESIEFYPGNYSPMYGRATGGIVDARIKQLAPKKIGGYADVSILDTGIYLEAPIGEKAAVAVAGRRSYVDYIINAAVPDNAPVDLITAPRYYDYQLLGSYRPTPKHDLRAMLFGSDDRFEVLFTEPGDFDPALTDNQFGYSTTFYRVLLSHRYVPHESFENTLRVSEGRDWMNLQIAQFAADLDIETVQVRDSARLELDRHWSLNTGIDLIYSKADLSMNIPRGGAMINEGEPGEAVDLETTVTSDVEVAAWYPGLYAEVEIKPGRGFLLLPSLRFDYSGVVEESSFEPRLTGRWQFEEHTTLKGGLGLFTKEPEDLEVDEQYGNPDLGLERAIHYSAGLEVKPVDYLTLDGTLFYKKLSNLVSPTDRVVERDGELRPLVYDNGGSGDVRGLELGVRHEPSNGLSGWIAYTLSRSMRLDSGATEERIFDYDQTHILTLVASYALPRNWQLGTRFRLVSGTPTTPIVGAVYDASRDEYQPTYGRVNSSRTGIFHQLDLRVDKRWIYDSWMLTAYLDLQNVYNRDNPVGVAHNYNFRESRPQSGLPLLPIIGLRGEF